MKTENYHKRITEYLASLTPADRETQFYQACMIAKVALIELDIAQNKLAIAERSALVEK